jgi:hypothetical protein
MDTGHLYWEGWARSLQQRKLNGAAEIILDALGPLTVILAQFIYIGQPYLQNLKPSTEWLDLAHMLEHPEESREFVALLHEERSDWLK